jgi:hypothetical protein
MSHVGDTDDYGRVLLGMVIPCDMPHAQRINQP